MTRTFRPTNAFVDESIRGPRYLMGCVLVEARHLASVRLGVTALVAEGKRLHFHQELDSTRRRALEVVAAMPIQVLAVVCVRGHGVTEFQARSACLAEIVRHLQGRGVPRLTVESRQDDRDDQRTIQRTRQPEPLLVFDHRDGQREPVLWVADAVTWAIGRGAPWLPLVEPVLDGFIDVRPQSAEPGSPTKGRATGSTSPGASPKHRQYAPGRRRSQAALACCRALNYSATHGCSAASKGPNARPVSNRG